MAMDTNTAAGRSVAASPDWYERQHELAPDQIFMTANGWVLLDRRVPCDGTQWYVAQWSGGVWRYEDATIEPCDLQGEPMSVPEFEAMITRGAQA
jgi:hypothetical protein